MSFKIGDFVNIPIAHPWHDRKERFPTEGAACRALGTIRVEAEETPEKRLKFGDVSTLRVYACDVGGTLHFHIGHWRAKDRPPIERAKHGKEEAHSAKLEEAEERRQAC